MSCQRLLRCEAFPFSLARQTSARPARIGIRLKIADMADRCCSGGGAQTVQTERQPCRTLTLPIERRLPAVCVLQFPTFRQPELLPRVATISYEISIFGVGDRAQRDLVGFEKNTVTRQFMVKTKPATGVTEAMHAVGLRHPFIQHRRWFDSAWCRRINRLQRVAREQMLQVGKEQFLMPLLMLHTALHHRPRRRCSSIQQGSDTTVDMAPIDQHLCERRARQHATLCRPIRGIKHAAKLRMKGLIAGDQCLQHMSLEKPGGMCEMPFDRSRTGPGLQRAIFC